jgi:hypothetical protein
MKTKQPRRKLGSAMTDEEKPARCPIPWAVCPDCVGQGLSADQRGMFCPSCRRRFAADEREPCPELATVDVRDQAGTVAHLCRSHAVNAAARMVGATVEGLSAADLAHVAELGARWHHEEKVRRALVEQMHERPERGELVPIQRSWPPPPPPREPVVDELSLQRSDKTPHGGPQMATMTDGVISGDRAAVDELSAALNKSREFGELRRQKWGDGDRYSMAKLCNLFPSLRGVDGADPWDSIKMLRHACDPISHGEELAARFVLSVWNSSTDWNEQAHELGFLAGEERLRPFDIFEAYSVWDFEHRDAALAWLTVPFNP